MNVLTGKPKSEMIWQSCANLLHTKIKMQDNTEYSTFIRSGTLFKRKLVRNETHGLSHERLYSIWKGMRYRCTNPKRPGYKYYGGKGIKVCDEWKDANNNGFINFFNWAINNGYEETLTIDRLDSNKDYEPSNCRWIPFIDNILLGASKKRNPEYKYIGINEEMNIIVAFYCTSDFEAEFKIDTRRISDCCNNRRKTYKGWKFTREVISVEERQETIRKRSTVEDEFPLEVRNIRMDDDIVHSA